MPVVLVGAAVTFLAWWLLDGNFGTAVLSGVAVLLVACPCAMGLATPVAMMVGTGRASALGILVRSGDALERLARADIVVFDKTGTLTERFAAVTGVAAVPDVTDDRVLALAAAVEAESEHPIAAGHLRRGPTPGTGHRRRGVPRHGGDRNGRRSPGPSGTPRRVAPSPVPGRRHLRATRIGATPWCRSRATTAWWASSPWPRRSGPTRHRPSPPRTGWD